MGDLDDRDISVEALSFKLRRRPAVVCCWCTPHHVIELGTLPASHGMCPTALAATKRQLDEQEESNGGH